jgi:hypothetical protein
MSNLLYYNRIIDIFDDIFDNIDMFGAPVLGFVQKFIKKSKRKKYVFVIKFIITISIIYKLFSYYYKNSKINFTDSMKNQIEKSASILKSSSYPTVYILASLKGIIMSKIFIVILNIYSLYVIFKDRNNIEEDKEMKSCNCRVIKLND